MLKLKSMFCLLQAFLMVVSSFSVYDSNFKRWVDRAAMKITSTTDFSFDSIAADELTVTEEEKNLCRDWYNGNILTTGNPAYDFTYGGKKLSSNLADWNISIGEESETGKVYRGGKTTYVTLTHKTNSLEATVEATIYEAFATCEWTVYIKNTGTENSPVIKNFYGADCSINTGSSEIYFSNGSDSDADDFETYKSAVSPTSMIFTANGGRTSSFLPYFNISGKNFGVIATNGWTGQWYSSIRQNLSGIHFKAKQEYFEAYLTAGEQVRSPLVSLTFYKNSNALKGFNTFRNWLSNCVYTESAFPLTCSVIAGEFDRRNADEYIQQINSYSEWECSESDFLWRDAGWYTINGDWYDSVGNWTADKTRFPDGFAPIAEAAEVRGMKLLLWYEPERCCKDTDVYNECIKHEGWLVDSGDENRNLVNLAFDGCCDYLSNLIANSIKENKVGLYRQDFNFSVLELWRQADEDFWGDREGIEENHYVTNLYRYLDTLLEVNPGLIIDNCASGGRRLDLEMARRSIPLWRTDYNCSDSEGKVNDDCLEATQVASYGLSFWLPLTGTGLNASGEYAERTLITPCTQRPGYKAIREYMDKNYYPLTYGGLDTSKFMATQFGDEEAGIALIYKRENVKENEYKLVLNGLSPDVTYTVTDYDGINAPVTKTGKELMTDGITLQINETPKAVIMEYSAAVR